MTKNRDSQFDMSEQEFTLEEILAEFSAHSRREGDLDLPDFMNQPRSKPSAPPAPPPAPEENTEKKVIRFPGKAMPEQPEPEEEPKEEIEPEPAPAPKPEPAPEPSPAPHPVQKIKKLPKKEPEPEPEGPSFLTRILMRADLFAARMFEHEEPSAEDQKAEQYMPGVDVEQPQHLRKRLAPRRRKVRTWPDTSPQELAAKYGKGLGSLRIRRFLVFVLALPLLYLCLAGPFPLPLPAPLDHRWLQIWICAGVHLVALGLSYDLVWAGISRLGADTLTIAASLVTLADACTMNFIGDRSGSLPYSLVCVLALGFGLWGKYMKQLTLRISCRTAAAAKTPYLVTLDEDRWDSRSVFSKWPGEVKGFGSQIQSDDGAMRVFRTAAPLLIVASLLFSAIASVGKGRPELFLWCLSATLCASASLSGALAFTLPSRILSRRLAGVGAALAGWEGVRRQAKNTGILLSDTDLFPPGSVVMNGVKVFPNHPLDKVISVTATLVRETGSGLDRAFHELLRSQGTVYRKAEDVHLYEGGVSAMVRGEHILVGNSSFMHMMEITMPDGLNVKNAVFCAINGELAGIFALTYALHATVRPSLGALIENKISPILATRDFNLFPAMLHQRFKLPAERMEFPEHSRRRELSDPKQNHDLPLVCILCREGIGPLSEAVVGAKRLCLATRISSTLSVIGSIIGVLLAFYLTAQMAFTSLSVLSLLVFLLMWLVPTLLISSWVNRY